MEKELKKAIKSIMKYDFYDSNKKAIEINLKENKTEELLKKVFIDSIMSIEFIRDDEDEEMRKVEDDELAAKLGDDVVNLFEKIQSEPKPKNVKKEKQVKEKKVKDEKVEEPIVVQSFIDEEDVTFTDLELEEAMEEVQKKDKKKKIFANGIDKFGFRNGSKCSLIMSIMEENKYTLNDLLEKLKGKTNIDPRKIARVVTGRGKYIAERNDRGIFIVEVKE